MSVETITIVLSAVGLLLGFVGAFGWMIRRVDGQLERFADRIDARFAEVDDRFARLEERLGSRMGAVERELVEIKIAVARLEGPPRRLIAAR